MFGYEMDYITMIEDMVDDWEDEIRAGASPERIAEIISIAREKYECEFIERFIARIPRLQK